MIPINDTELRQGQTQTPEYTESRSRYRIRGIRTCCKLLVSLFTR